MNKIRVNYIFRKRGKGHNSIEELFQSIIAHVPETIDARIVELPYAGASLKSVVLNLWHVVSLKGIIHVTGDVYYIGLIPFKKTILTIHDANVLELDDLSPLKKLLIKWIWYTLPLMVAKKITVISNFTKSQISVLYPAIEKKTQIIYNPVNPILERNPKQALSNPPVVLHLGTKPHKNLKHTIKAIHQCNYKLISVGPLSKEHYRLLKDYPISHENYTNLDFQGIKALYETCDVVSFLSYLEGFGMPIIEAQKVGRPVVASDRCSIPEVGGDGVLYVNPDDVASIAAAYKKVVEDRPYRAQLIDFGYKNVKRFDIDVISTQYCNLYQEIC